MKTNTKTIKTISKTDALKTAVDAIKSDNVREAVKKALTKPAIKTAVKTATKPKTAVKTATKPKTAVKTATKTGGRPAVVTSGLMTITRPAPEPVVRTGETVLINGKEFYRELVEQVLADDINVEPSGAPTAKSRPIVGKYVFKILSDDIIAGAQLIMPVQTLIEKVKTASPVPIPVKSIKSRRGKFQRKLYHALIREREGIAPAKTLIRTGQEAAALKEAKDGASI